VRTNKIFCQVSGSESLDHNQCCTDKTKQELHVPKTRDKQSRNLYSVPAVDHDDQVRRHVDEGPRHANHVHVVKVKLDILRNCSCKARQWINIFCIALHFDASSNVEGYFYHDLPQAPMKHFSVVLLLFLVIKATIVKTKFKVRNFARLLCLLLPESH